VQRRLGSVKIAEQADQGGKNLQRFGAVEGGQVRTTNATLSGRNSHRFPVSHN